MPSTFSKLWRSAAILLAPLWVYWVFRYYAVYQRRFREAPEIVDALVSRVLAPQSPHFFENHLVSLLSVLSVACLIFTVLAIGRLLRIRIPELADESDPFVVELLLGLVGLSTLMFGLAAVHLWYPSVVVVLSVALVLLAKPHRLWPRSLGFPSRTSLLWWLPIVAAFCFIFAFGVSPEVYWDPLLYHLGAPAKWIIEHGFYDSPTHYAMNLPLWQSMLYGYLLMIGPDEAPGLVQPLMLLTAVVLVAIAVRRYAPRSRGAVGALGLMSAPAVIFNVSTSGNDVAVMMYVAFAAAFFSRWDAGSKRESDLYLASLAIGAAIACKYQAGIALVLLLALVVPGERRPRVLATCVLLAAAPVLPWLVKNLVLTHNPIFPLWPEVFGSSHMSPQRLEIARRQIASNVTTDWITFISFPWSTSLRPGAPEDLLGPFFLFAAPLGLLGLKLNRPTQLWRAGLVAIAWCVWAFLFSRVRYATPQIVATILLIGIGWARGKEHVSTWASLFGDLTLALGGAVVVFSSILFWQETNEPDEYYSGKMDEVGYLMSGVARTSPNSPAQLIETINEELDPDKNRVLLIGEHRSFGIRVPHVSQTVFDDLIVLQYVKDAADPAEVFDRLKRAGITHIAVNLAEAQRLHRGYGLLDVDEASGTLWSKFFTRYAKVEKVISPCVLYRIDASEAPEGDRPFDPLIAIRRSR